MTIKYGVIELDEPIPRGSILGLNYNGMHDSAIAIVAPSGKIIFAAALERFSRVKQDGRPPHLLTKDLPWHEIETIAVSTEKNFEFPINNTVSNLLEVKLRNLRPQGLQHATEFYDFLDSLPCHKEFVCHQMAHAASAFWSSGFDNSLCFTYDGGMCNSPWFGGLYQADKIHGIQELDQFNSLQYAKITSLYTFVTTLLGFTPNKHEGKITGLAALGKPTDPCRAMLKHWFEHEFELIESVMRWIAAYDSESSPMLVTNAAKLAPFITTAASFSKEELAATVQEFTEQHVHAIIRRAQEHEWLQKNICLAGGLFANVKLNQAIAFMNFEQVFIAPPMTDDGAALGAAWHVLSKKQPLHLEPLQSMYLGNSYTKDEIQKLLHVHNIKFTTLPDSASKIATLLAEGKIIALFQGRMEFGPRSLGNRSILASAANYSINHKLNTLLNRTEFMPFAPVSLIEDADDCYININKVRHAAEFMTVTVVCTAKMQAICPAVVHVDKTARPQLVKHTTNPLMHAILTKYKQLTNQPALVNTSFNIHEEPIICSPEDALRGFFAVEIDYICFEGHFLVAFNENQAVKLAFSQKPLQQSSQKLASCMTTIQAQEKDIMLKDICLAEKEHCINDQAAQLEQQAKLIRKYNIILRNIPGLYLCYIIREICKPRLGILNQYNPRALTKLPTYKYLNDNLTPKVSIVTPSFCQYQYIERTIQSVLNQDYPAIEYFIQDGGSRDHTIPIIKNYANKISGWNSRVDTGQSQAINRGFANTAGEIMAWLNADDILLPGTVACVVDYFNSHPEVDVIYGNRLIIDENDLEIGRWIMPGHSNKALSWIDFIPQETLFWRRNIWELTGGYIDESFNFAMDWDLLVRFREAGARFAHIPRFLGAFRVHGKQKTSTVINTVGFAEMNKIRQRTLGYIPSRIEIKKSIRSFILRHIMVDMGYRLKRRFISTRL